jgi:hypothetical protein
MTTDAMKDVEKRVKELHRLLASEGPTNRTGRALRALSEVCSPAGRFVEMWDAVTSPLLRRNVARDAVSDVVAHLE